jgi:hypothetical protein
MPPPPIRPTQQIPPARQFELLPTRDPSTVSFRISESAQTFRSSQIPKQGTKFGNTVFIQTRAQQDNYANYTYQYMSRDGDNLWFYFTFPYSETIDPVTGQPLNQVPYNTYTTNKRWSWPAVLHRLIFVPDSLPLITAVPNASDAKGYSQAFVQRLVPRRVFTPPTSALCECLVEQFVSDTPWPTMEHPQPVDGEVEWELPGTSERITCLHPRIEIPSSGRPYTIVVNATPTNTSQIGSKRIFPATNFEDWEPFVLSDEVTRENGVYLRERVTIYPPAANERTVQ